MRCRVIRPSANDAGQTASSAPLVNPNRSSSVGLMTRNQHDTAVSSSKIARESLASDIEQALTGRNLIKPTDLLPKQAKDFDLHCAEPFNQVMDLALLDHANPMNPFEQLEDPT